MTVRALVVAACAGGVVGCASMAAGQPQFFPIPGTCYDVNNGGTVVVGNNGVGSYRWARSGSNLTFTILPNSLGVGLTRCSADGSIITGEMPNGDEGAFENGLPPTSGITGRWTASTGFESLGVFTTNPPFPASAFETINTPYDITDDGHIVVGLAYLPGGGFNNFRAYRADVAAGTLISLGSAGGEGSRANCVSANGLVVGGFDRGETGSNLPAVWRISPIDGSVTQFTLANTDQFGEIGACNPDGSVIAGSSTDFPGQLVVWTWNGSAYLPSTLGTIDDGNVTVTGMSNDGQTIVGTTGGFFARDAFMWTPATGMVRLLDHLTALGTTGLPPDASFGAVLGISPDGRSMTVGGFFATSGLVLLDGGAPCLAPVPIAGPSTQEISRCESSAFLNVSATGSGPFTYQWRKDNQEIFPGPSGTGSTYEFGFFGANQLIIQNGGPADAGTYDCVISNACGSVVSGSIPLTVRQSDPYDTCATALEASGTGTVALAMCGAYVHERPASCGGDIQNADVWIRYTAIEAGDYRITTCGQPGFDTILSLYDSCESAETACDNDFCFSLASIERVTLSAGQVVYVRLAASFVPYDPVQVLFEMVPPAPANDLCTNAQVIPGPGSVSFDNNFAGNEGSASCRFDNGGRDIWYRYTTAESGRLTISTCGAVLDTTLSVFDDCSGAELACNDGLFSDTCFFQAQIDALPLTAGQSVVIRLASSQRDASGSGVMVVTFEPGLVCRADLNGDGNLDPDDLADYIACYFTPPCDQADFDGSGTVDPDDLADYIAAYFSGCD